MATYSLPVSTRLISICKWFSAQKKNVTQGHNFKLTYLYAHSIMYIRHHLQIWNWMPKVARNTFNIGGGWNPVCCHGNEIVKLKLWNTLIIFSRILRQRIKHFSSKLAEISFFITFDQNLVEYMTSSLG